MEWNGMEFGIFHGGTDLYIYMLQADEVEGKSGPALHFE
jgi:hypothetical protein